MIFAPLYRTYSLDRYVFVSNGAVERVVRKKEWDAKHHVSHCMHEMLFDHVLTGCSGYCFLGGIQPREAAKQV
jgi:hypothetical protein